MSMLELLLANQTEIMTLTVIALMMAISPGADFVLVTRNSLSCSRRSGIFTTLGITCGTWVHVSYCIAGMAIVISTSSTMFSMLKIVGAIYLIFIGYSSIKANTVVTDGVLNAGTSLKPISAFISGFLSNALNPKTTLFFLGIFTQFVTVDTPVTIQLVYGAIISLAHLIWFLSLSYLLTHQKLLPKVKAYQVIINYLMGAVLIALGLKLIFF